MVVTGGIGDSTDPAIDSRANLTVSGAIHPLQALIPTPSRRFDLGVGYMGSYLFTDNVPDPQHGPFLDLAVHPWVNAYGEHPDTFAGRLVLRVAPEWVLAGSSRGVGVTTGLGIERAAFFDGAFSGSSGQGGIAGRGYGEVSFGVEVTTSYRRVAGEEYWTVGGSLVLRLPASYGVILAVP